MQLRGLYTHPNPLSEVPQGALIKAKNVVLDKEGIIETRRGMKQYGIALPLTTGQKLNQILNYQDSLLLHAGTTFYYDSDNAGTWLPYSGAFNPPSGAAKIRGLEANKNFYFSTSSGIFKLDQLTGTPVAAGGIKALDGVASITGVSGFLDTNNQVAYRVVWGSNDANNNLILGAPSQRIIVTNASGHGVDVNLTITIPAGVTTSYFFQVYRSFMSGGSTLVPNDELFLVYEANPTAGELSALSVTITDSTPESLFGATLYTSPSQEGITQENDSPPLCLDFTSYLNFTFYANTISKQRLTLTMIAVGGSAGVQIGDTIQIGATTYMAAASEDPTTGKFLVDTSGTPAENIASTSQSLVRVINQYTANTQYYAYYLSGYNDLPGKFLIEERSIGGSTLAVISNNGGAYSPNIPTSGTSLSTTSDAQVNRIFISKIQQPEAVPLLNYISVGSANKPIYRVIALRDSVFVLKEDGVFRITGQDLSSFTISLFDSTVDITAPESAIPFNNQIFAYTSQGVVGISDTGTQIMSRPIEVDLLPISTYPNFSTLTFGLDYQSDRKYILSVQSVSSDKYPTQQYVFNSLTGAWTRWDFSVTCGKVNSFDDKLYFGSATSPYVYQERKSFSTDDYADEEKSITITAMSGTTVYLADASGLSTSWSLSQDSHLSAIVSVVNSTTIIVSSAAHWNLGAATAYKAINTEIETEPQTTGNPGILKQFRDITVFFRHANFRNISLNFKSNLSASLEKVSITLQGSWGSFNWGKIGWGGTSADLLAIRTFIPRNKQRAHWISLNITHAVAREYFALAGLSIQFENMSERFK